MKFNWSAKTINDWRHLLNRVPQSNWMQSWPFAKAIRTQDQKVTRVAVIEENERPIGVMALQEIKLGPVHIMNLHRGPLWFIEDPPESYFADFAKLFAQTFPRRLLRRRRWLPEWKKTESARKILEENGFSRTRASYQTISLRLDASVESLRQKLKQKWRNALSKGERSDLEVTVDWDCRHLDIFLNQYRTHRYQKKYLGYGPNFLRAEIEAARPFREVALVWARKNNMALAGIMILLHGRSATYRAGWTTSAGRGCNAHNVLLWEAIKAVKERGIAHFDLGGIDTEKGEGLSHFKQGLGGEEVQLLGVFR